MAAKGPVSSALGAPPTTFDSSPIVSKPLPLFTKIEYAIRAYLFQTFVKVALAVDRLLRFSKYKAVAPTYTKRYPVRPTLESRVFLPKSYVSGTRLPLYIDIHGGGFVLCDPATDDHFCHYFANEFGYCVVSIDYRKAPSYPFPYGVDDCVALTRAVLADDDLPVDHNKVVMGGFSAGGNLALAVAQSEDLRAKFKALVPIYPVTDFTGRYRGEYRPNKDGKPDTLKDMAKIFNWSYVSPGVNRSDNLLSVIFATKAQLPQKMYFVGAEYDSLCQEANLLAKRLAGIENESDVGPTWSRNGIRWETLPDQQHGFTHIELKGEKEIARQQMCNDLYRRIDQWIKKEVF